MASATDSARQGTNITTAGTTHAVNVGSPVSGTLLIVLARFAAAPGTIGFTGYIPLNGAAGDSSDATDDTTIIFYRWADGTEGATDDMTTGNSVKACMLGYEITGASLVQPPVISTVNVGTTTANTAQSNVAPVSGPAGNQEYLFLTLMGLDGELNAPTVAPTNYANLATANSGTTGAVATNCSIGGASRALTANSDDPGVFTHAAATGGWTAYTVAIFSSSYVRPFSGPSVENIMSVQRASVW